MWELGRVPESVAFYLGSYLDVAIGWLVGTLRRARGCVVTGWNRQDPGHRSRDVLVDTTKPRGQ